MRNEGKRKVFIVNEQQKYSSFDANVLLSKMTSIRESSFLLSKQKELFWNCLQNLKETVKSFNIRIHALKSTKKSEIAGQFYLSCSVYSLNIVFSDLPLPLLPLPYYHLSYEDKKWLWKIFRTERRKEYFYGIHGLFPDEKGWKLTLFIWWTI